MSQAKPPQRLTACPETPGCTQTPVWKTSDGSLWYQTSRGEFHPHKCTVRGNPEKPKTVYMGEFKNTRTGSTRYTPLAKLERSAHIPPHDDPARRKTPISRSEWEEVDIWVMEGEWKRLPKKEDS